MGAVKTILDVAKRSANWILIGWAIVGIVTTLLHLWSRDWLEILLVVTLVMLLGSVSLLIAKDKALGSKDEATARGLNDIDDLVLLVTLMRLFTADHRSCEPGQRQPEELRRWANQVEDIVNHSELDLNFLREIPPQWRRQEFNVGAIEVAHAKLINLIKERDHFRSTKLAMLTGRSKLQLH